MDTNLIFEIHDSNDFIKILPMQLMYPKAEIDWDRNWIKAEVFVKAGFFNGQYPGDFLTTDFEILKQRLKKLYDNLSGEVTFKQLEYQLVLKIKGDGLGHFSVNVKVTPESQYETSLSYSLSFDQTEIKNLLHQLDAITKAYPIVGDFKIPNE